MKELSYYKSDPFDKVMTTELFSYTLKESLIEYDECVMAGIYSASGSIERKALFLWIDADDISDRFVFCNISDNYKKSTVINEVLSSENNTTRWLIDRHKNDSSWNFVCLGNNLMINKPFAIDYMEIITNLYL